MSRKSTLLLSGLFFLLLSCEKPTDFTAIAPETIVVSEFTSNRTLEVSVYRASNLFDSTARRYILDADVEVYRGEEFQTSLHLDSSKAPPCYTNVSFLPTPNATYRIEVQLPGQKLITANSRIPNPIEIHQLEVSDLDLNPTSTGLEYNFRVSIQFEDPSEEANFYHLNFSQQILKSETGVPDFELREEKVTFSSRFNIDQFTVAGNGGLLFSDESFNGSRFAYTFPMRFNLEPEEHLGKLRVELRAVSEDYYLFQTSLTRQKGPGTPIQGDVLIYNNIQNGLGIFAGYNFSVDSVAVQ